MLILRIVAIFWIGLMVLAAGMASSQSYPSKPIRIITTAAGGANDFLGRIIAQGISGPLGQPVIVENRAGTVTNQAETALRGLPDGYTLLLVSNVLWNEPLLRKTPYDPIKDFSPISLVTSAPAILVVPPSLPVKSVNEMIALAKARPGELNYGSSNVGGQSHLASELFKAMAGVNIVLVPYKGTAQVLIDLVSGRIHMFIVPGSTLGPYITSGKLRALAVTSAKPSTLFPGLPTIASDLPGYESGSTNVIFSPAKTPATIINRLNQEIVRVLKGTEVKERLFNSGTEVVANLPEEAAAAIKSNMASMGKVIKDAGIKAE